MYCVWCDGLCIPEMNWENLWSMGRTKTLCNQCENALKVIDGNRCKKCSCQLKEKQYICSDCMQWEQRFKQDPLKFNYSIFNYNERMQDMVTRWKYRGDYHLSCAFEQIFIETFKNTFAFLSKKVCVISIPLSSERILERGFNQAKVLADYLIPKREEFITRVYSEKQSKKTRKERLATKNPFFLTKKVNKPVILVDDIYTTGRTLRHAAELLLENGCPAVYAYTLIRS
ncbi:ComF family protein [Virgibacillus alimentarius]|uniref:Competence protein ComFC n=1 Tax=Virgibacillus alimentarius TaxID=698769 RepID=A0ABS4S5L4_9BACI|nr:ComF family protein [Virgibacillus alimentarius]MBP2256787.1 competence protein ComFC [Virgibacillus alimentarius]